MTIHELVTNNVFIFFLVAISIAIFDLYEYYQRPQRARALEIEFHLDHANEGYDFLSHTFGVPPESLKYEYNDFFYVSKRKLGNAWIYKYDQRSLTTAKGGGTMYFGCVGVLFHNTGTGIALAKVFETFPDLKVIARKESVLIYDDCGPLAPPVAVKLLTAIVECLGYSS